LFACLADIQMAGGENTIDRWLLKAEPLPHVVGGRDVGSYPFERLLTEPEQIVRTGVAGGQSPFTANS
jgi:hypothetical protein